MFCAQFIYIKVAFVDSRQTILSDLEFFLLGTGQRDLPVILKKQVFSGEFDPMSFSFKVIGVTTWRFRL